MGLIRTGKPRGGHYRTCNPRNKAAKASSIMAAIVQAQCAMRIAPVASTKASGRVSLKAGFAGKPVQAASVSLSSRRAERLVVRAEEAKAPARLEKAAGAWSLPSSTPTRPSPIFGGSTGSALRKAQVSTGIFFSLAGNRLVERGSEEATRGALVDRGRKPPRMLRTTIEYHRIRSVRRVMRRCSTAHSRRARVIRTHHARARAL